ncbi:MAG TPA: methyltransferase regulatory domain-containing protein [Pirellulales bacterium]|jgi:SAM-dependent methyltransferase/methyltransferase-like protein|nr:methyltransferase regulatory domain-containing protein [Pirellulales bacterium]
MTTIYDQIPYPRHTYGFTHPDRLATLATLHGLEPPPVDSCRVLELGCASGSNLIPMAYALPRSEFVGIDLSARQIADGQQFITAVGVKNIRLAVTDIRSIDESLGKFDYIIAHGVHSWVPPDVQEAILLVCGHQLSEQGVALVSYNAYPGCHLRQMVRGMGQFHVRDIENPPERVAQLHALVRFLVGSLGDDYKVYREVLQDEADRLAKLSDVFILHDVLEEWNYPIYFHQFVEQAARHGLQYLAEALPLGRHRATIAPDLLDEMRRKYDLIEYEQHLDFLDGTAFRRTLICRESNRLNRNLRSAALERLLIASQASPVSAAPELHGDRPEEFAARKGQMAAAIRCDRPTAKAAMMILNDAYPRAMTLATILQASADKLSRSPAAEDEREIREVILGGFDVGAIELHCWQPNFADAISEFPEASAIARHEAAHGWDATTLWHDRLVLNNPVSRQLLSSLDGRHDRQRIVEHLVSAILADRVSSPGPVTHSASEVRAEVEKELDTALRDLARSGILIR